MHSESDDMHGRAVVIYNSAYAPLMIYTRRASGDIHSESDDMRGRAVMRCTQRMMICTAKP